MSNSLPLPDGYTELLEQIKDRIRALHVRSAPPANREMVLLYWHVGNELLMRQKTAGWDVNVIDQISADLQREFPHLSGFSPGHLKDMQALAEVFPDVQIAQQAVAHILSELNVHIRDELGTSEARLAGTPAAELADNLPTIDELETEFGCTSYNPDDESPDQSP